MLTYGLESRCWVYLTDSLNRSSPRLWQPQERDEAIPTAISSHGTDN